MENVSYKNRLAILALTAVFSGCSSDGDDNSLLASTDNCPGFENPDQLDTDFDGVNDACDPDDDGDGFFDVDDPVPLDDSIPGDFSTPEAILNNEAIQRALSGAEAAGFPVVTETGLNPPDLTGYFSRADAASSFLANSSTFDQGRGWIGAEFRHDQSADNSFDRSTVSFTGFTPVAFALSSGSIIRGEGNRFTAYTRGMSTCTECGSNFEPFSVGIESATFNSETGDLGYYRRLGTTVDVAGELTTVCADRLTGESELVDSWVVGEVGAVSRVLPSELVYMCVDEDVGYAPTEIWTDSLGLSCSCGTDYQISCE